MESNKEHIAAALETLRPTSSWERATAAGQGVEGVSMGGRGFGVAMDALIKYLGPEYGVTFAMGTSLFFLIPSLSGVVCIRVIRCKGFRV